jgi:hypothetical protein
MEFIESKCHQKGAYFNTFQQNSYELRHGTSAEFTQLRQLRIEPASLTQIPALHLSIEHWLNSVLARPV